MTEREKFEKALKREKIEGHVPTFELVYFLTMEKLGKVHPCHRVFTQWSQMSTKERELQLRDIAYCYGEIAKIYHHSAVFIQGLPGDFDDTIRFLEIFAEMYNREYSVMFHGDPTNAIPTGEDMVDFSVRMYEEPDKFKNEQIERQKWLADYAEKIANRGHLLDGFALCSDYCFNVNPFYPKDVFDDLVAPVLSDMTKNYHDLGYYVIKHTDGNIMPILDSLVQCKPDAIHSLDPQGGVDLKEVKRLVGDKVCLIGNVNCGLLQTGSEEDVIKDVRRALRDGMPGYGYIFATSNCVYTGLDIKRYELMNKIWWEEGIYKN